MRYKCHNCEKAFTIEEWDRSTTAYYGPMIQSMTQALKYASKERTIKFICPSCNGLNRITDEKLEIALETNEDAKGLLRKDW